MSARVTEAMVEAGARAAFDVWWADRGDGYEYSWLCGKSAWKKQIRAALEAAAALSTESVPVAWLRRRDIDGPCNAIPAWKTQSDGADVAVYTAPISTEPGEAEGWQPIETAPFDKPVDLWCIQGYEREATWPVRGFLVGGRHKNKDYGWFGNESKDGVPQKDAPDLVPVAWRPVNVPTDLVAKFLCPAGRTALEDKP